LLKDVRCVNKRTDIGQPGLLQRMHAERPVDLATLTSARLRIAPLVASDLGFYKRLYCDPQTMALVGDPLSSAAAGRSFEAALRCHLRSPAKRLSWTLTDVSMNEQIGLLALIRELPDLGSDDAEVGALILPSAQGRAYAAEAIATLAAHAFGDLGIDRLVTRHSRDNRGADGLMRKLGFRRVADGDGAQPCRWELERDV
jgi:RimJ/RimL family protein N-acetyltransferase